MEFEKEKTMLHKRQIANINFTDNLVTVKNKDLNLSFNYSSIQMLYINNEMDETAREMEVSLKKLKKIEPELADLLRMRLSVNDISFIFVVSRGEGEIIAKHVENTLRQTIINADVVKGSLADEVKQDYLNEYPNDDVVYPIYFHGCGGFDNELEDDEFALQN